MMDFQIKRTGRRCHATERELKPGDEFYSELVQDAGELQRRDFCTEAWEGPDADSIGWWRSTIPKTDSGRVYWAPREVLLSYFESLTQNEKYKSTAYVMALVLVRKRILKLVDSTKKDGAEVLEVHYGKENKTYIVPVVELSPDEMNEIQQELAQQLFMDHPPE